jgi:hypothetical protein
MRLLPALIVWSLIVVSKSALSVVQLEFLDGMPLCVDDKTAAVLGVSERDGAMQEWLDEIVLFEQGREIKLSLTVMTQNRFRARHMSPGEFVSDPKDRDLPLLPLSPGYYRIDINHLMWLIVRGDPQLAAKKNLSGMQWQVGQCQNFSDGKTSCNRIYEYGEYSVYYNFLESDYLLVDKFDREIAALLKRLTNCVSE